MVAEHGRRDATYADLVALPEHVVGEIIDGELIVSPRPAIPHASASSGLGYVLSGPFRYGIGGPGGWVILDEPELHFGRDVLVPDVAGWRRERMPEAPETVAVELAPDWICEVLSPSTERVDRARKLRVYAREGVAHAWLVSPLAQTVEVLALEAGRWVQIDVFEGDAKIKAPPFEAVELDLALVWQR